MHDRLGFVDIGARGGASDRTSRYRDRLLQVLVEPDAEEAMRLTEASDDGQLYTVVSSALGDTDGDGKFYMTQNPTCASLLPVNYDLINNYEIAPHFRLKEVRDIKCARYDTLFSQNKVPLPIAIKIDVQGYEYNVLSGFGALLNQCLAIELETHVYPIYLGEKTFQEIVNFLGAWHFVLRRISNPRSPELRGDRHFDGDLVEFDAHFTKSRKWLKQQNEAIRGRFRLACEVLDIDSYPGV